ncbi:MAG: tetratricopeptide repeat protein [Blastocatellales bacterium]
MPQFDNKLAGQVYEFGQFRLEVGERQLLRAGEPVRLTPKVFDLLVTLVENSGRLLEKEELMEKVWPDSFVEEGNINRNISTLRRALDGDGDGEGFIETVPKRGYRFVAPIKLVECADEIVLQRRVQARIVASEEIIEAEPADIQLPQPSLDRKGLIPSQPHKSFRWKYLWLAGILLSLLVAGFWFLLQRRAQPRTQQAQFQSAGLTGAEQQRLVKRYTDNPESYQAYVKGHMLCHKRTTESFQQGIEYLNQAVEKDARNALAWYALSECYQLMGESSGHSMVEMLQKSTLMALKAVEIDENFAEAQAQLGFLEMTQWYVTSAERRLRRAIELNPDLAESRARYGIVLLAQGRFEEALAEARRCQELAPLALLTRIHVARGLYMARRYDEAIAQCREYIKLDPGFATAHLYLGLSYYQQGRFAAALTPLQKAVELSDGRDETKGALAQNYVKLNRPGEALRILNELKEQAVRNMHGNYYVATVYAAMGEKEQAFAWLEKVWQQRHPIFAVRFKIDPNLDPLRSDPRYNDLLRRVGLTP